ncbi:MAG: YceI family protein [Solirubrobacteraceae bacterium]
MDVRRHLVRPPTSFPDTGQGTLARGAWQLEPGRSTVAFAVPYWWGLGTVKGHFRQYAGRLELGARPAIELTIDAASVDTGNARRDRRLRSEEFFAVNRDPYIRFVSRTVRLADDRLSVLGDLMARGSRIEVEVDATVTAVDDEFQLEAETFVMHSGLGITWNPAQITRPWSKLVVGGRLVQAPVEPAEPRASSPGRRFARACRNPSPHGARRSQR